MRVLLLLGVLASCGAVNLRKHAAKAKIDDSHMDHAFEKFKAKSENMAANAIQKGAEKIDGMKHPELAPMAEAATIPMPAAAVAAAQAPQAAPQMPAAAQTQQTPQMPQMPQMPPMPPMPGAEPEAAAVDNGDSDYASAMADLAKIIEGAEARQGAGPAARDGQTHHHKHHHHKKQQMAAAAQQQPMGMPQMPQMPQMPGMGMPPMGMGKPPMMGGMPPMGGMGMPPMGMPGMMGMGKPPMMRGGMGMPGMMGRPPMGMPMMGMMRPPLPPMGMPPMGMPPMGMPPRGMPPMGMMGMGKPPMGMMGMGKPPMGMPGMPGMGMKGGDAPKTGMPFGMPQMPAPGMGPMGGMPSMATLNPWGGTGKGSMDGPGGMKGLLDPTVGKTDDDEDAADGKNETKTEEIDTMYGIPPEYAAAIAQAHAQEQLQVQESVVANAMKRQHEVAQVKAANDRKVVSMLTNLTARWERQANASEEMASKAEKLMMEITGAQVARAKLEAAAQEEINARRAHEIDKASMEHHEEVLAAIKNHTAKAEARAENASDVLKEAFETFKKNSNRTGAAALAQQGVDFGKLGLPGISGVPPMPGAVPSLQPALQAAQTAKLTAPPTPIAMGANMPMAGGGAAGVASPAAAMTAMTRPQTPAAPGAPVTP